MRRAAWPLREAMATLYRDPIPLIDDEERVYLRDCYDHMVQIIDLLENYRDVTSGLMEVYLSSISNRTNEIMKVLTSITVVLLPLTLICRHLRHELRYRRLTLEYARIDMACRLSVCFRLNGAGRANPYPLFPNKRLVGISPKDEGV